MARKFSLSIGIVLVSLIGTVAWASPLKAPDAHVYADPLAARANQITAVEERSVSVPSSFRKGDCRWMNILALEAGFERNDLPTLRFLARRESGCCPNVRGGDVTDQDCNVLKVVDWSHRSDSGLLQINGVHWKKDHPEYRGLVCREMRVCSQEPLFDPLTNLRAAKLLYDVAGWSPWGLD